MKTVQTTMNRKPKNGNLMTSLADWLPKGGAELLGRTIRSEFDQLKDEIRHRFTAEFLGQTNLVEAKAEGGFLTLPWGQSVSFDGAERGQVFLSIRPEEIAVADEGAPGVVNELTFLGGAVDYRVTVGPVALRVRMPAPAALLSVGDRVMIRLPRRLHVLQLDRDSPN